MNSLEEHSRWALVILVMVFVAMCALVIISSGLADKQRDACYHPVTPPMKVFVVECMSEGYDFGQCYYAYVDAAEHGSVMLEMPKTLT